MSAYSEVQTAFNDAETLCVALREMGFSEVQLHETAKHLTGYRGDKRAETAEIIIPRSAVGYASNDIGFKRQPDGSFQAIISEFDSAKHNADWLRQVKAKYIETGILAKAKKAGLKSVGKKIVNGKLKLQFVKA